MDIEFQIGIGDADIGALSRFLTEIIHYSVLNLVCNKLGMPEFLRINYRIDRERRVKVQIILPFHTLNGIINGISIRCLEILNRFQYSDSRSQAEIGTIEQFLVARERNHTMSYLDIIPSEFNNFLCQNTFKTLKGFSNQIKFCHKML